MELRIRLLPYTSKKGIKMILAMILLFLGFTNSQLGNEECAYRLYRTSVIFLLFMVVVNIILFAMTGLGL